MYEKIILIKRKTRLTELVERLNTVGQARFYITRSGGDFCEYEREHETYENAITVLKDKLNVGLKTHVIDRAFVPNFLFTQKDIIVTAGQDGIVANTAKYVGEQPIIAVNPDPERFDGILLPFGVAEADRALTAVLSGKAKIRGATLAEASLNDGQRLRAFNDLFIGVKSHTSARYQITYRKSSEAHSSSGVIISTGAGSTGWLSSIFRAAARISQFTGGPSVSPVRFERDDQRLIFAVREPFQSRYSQAELVMGFIEPGTELVLESLMPNGGVIFSDGVEADFLHFNSGAKVKISAAKHTAQLVVR